MIHSQLVWTSIWYQHVAYTKYTKSLISSHNFAQFSIYASYLLNHICSHELPFMVFILPCLHFPMCKYSFVADKFAIIDQTRIWPMRFNWCLFVVNSYIALDYLLLSKLFRINKSLINVNENNVKLFLLLSNLLVYRFYFWKSNWNRPEFENGPSVVLSSINNPFEYNWELYTILLRYFGGYSLIKWNLFKLKWLHISDFIHESKCGSTWRSSGIIFIWFFLLDGSWIDSCIKIPVSKMTWES